MKIKRFTVMAMSLAWAGLSAVVAAPVFVGTFGSFGTGNGQFDAPWGVSAASDGTVYVSDFNANRVQYFDANGNFLGKFGSSGSGPGQFLGAYYLTVTRDGTKVVVSDYTLSRVQTFDRQGEFLSEFPTPFSPNAIAADALGNLWLGNYNGNSLEVYSLAGGLLNTFSVGGALSAPEGIAPTPSGQIVVSNYNLNQVVRVSAEGALAQQFGVMGSGPGQFSRPTGIAVALNGTIYVVDSNNNRVQYFNASGAFLGSFGTLGTGPGQLTGPNGIAVLPNGRIYVSDTVNNRIAIFEDSDIAVRPTVTVAGKAKFTTRKTKVTLQGTASAANGSALKTIFVQVGKQKLSVSGSPTWTASVRLKPGKNRVTVYSEDVLGQVSPTVTRMIISEKKPKKR